MEELEAYVEAASERQKTANPARDSIRALHQFEFVNDLNNPLENRIDSVEKWVAEGTYQFAVDSRLVPPDSVEYHMRKIYGGGK